MGNGALQSTIKDAWARIEPHGRELRCMGAHGGAWTRTTAKGHALSCSSRSGLQSRDAELERARSFWGRLTSTWRGTAPHGRARRRMETYPAHGHELQRNAMNNCHAGRTARCRCASLYINDYEWCIVIYTCIIKIWLVLSTYGLTAIEREMSTPPAIYMEYGPLYLFLSVQKHITMLQQTITHSVIQSINQSIKPCVQSVRVHAAPCAPMHLNSRPCASMRAHAFFSTTGQQVSETVSGSETATASLELEHSDQDCRIANLIVNTKPNKKIYNNMKLSCVCDKLAAYCTKTACTKVLTYFGKYPAVGWAIYRWGTWCQLEAVVGVIFIYRWAEVVRNRSGRPWHDTLEFG